MADLRYKVLAAARGAMATMARLDQIIAAARAALPAWVPREIFDNYVAANRAGLEARLTAKARPSSLVTTAPPEPPGRSQAEAAAAEAAEAKIRKLLALAESAEKIGELGESRAARASAERLAARHGLSLEEIQRTVVVSLSDLLGFNPDRGVPWTNAEWPVGLGLFAGYHSLSDWSFLELGIPQKWNEHGSFDEANGALVIHYTSPDGNNGGGATVLHRGWWPNTSMREALRIASAAWGLDFAGSAPGRGGPNVVAPNLERERLVEILEEMGMVDHGPNFGGTITISPAPPPSVALLTGGTERQRVDLLGLAFRLSGQSGAWLVDKVPANGVLLDRHGKAHRAHFLDWEHWRAARDRGSMSEQGHHTGRRGGLVRLVGAPERYPI